MRLLSASLLVRISGALTGAALSWSSPGPFAEAGEAGTTHRVTIEKFAFVPARISIRPGDTVVWVNRDYAPHTATAGNGGWDAGTLAKHRSAAVVFRTAGRFVYFCKHHPHMRGTVVVTVR